MQEHPDGHYVDTSPLREDYGPARVSGATLWTAQPPRSEDIHAYLPNSFESRDTSQPFFDAMLEVE